MKSYTLVAIATFAAAVSASVPHEHAWDVVTNDFRRFNKLDIDPIFGLLGAQVAGSESAKSANAAVRAGGEACLQQFLSDVTIAQCGTDKTCLTRALQYRTLERNSGGVGAASNDCNVAPTSALLSTLKQRQDPNNAAAPTRNKEIELALMKVLVEGVGLSANDAATAVLETATFGPLVGPDNTNARGTSCDGPTSANRDFNVDRQNFGQPVLAPQDFTDPITGISHRSGSVIDCITLASFQQPGTPFGRNPLVSRAELVASVGNNAGGNTGNNGGNTGNTGGNTGNTGGGLDAATVQKLIDLLNQAVTALQAA